MYVVDPRHKDTKSHDQQLFGEDTESTEPASCAGLAAVITIRVSAGSTPQ